MRNNYSFTCIMVTYTAPHIYLCIHSYMLIYLLCTPLNYLLHSNTLLHMSRYIKLYRSREPIATVE